ncbi:putative rta1-like protein [Moniliophthora roreri MCA 2997]|uniref:Rta1-like protein n=2 Tax=Moniliophthora roreri TaxID=221103 RepID=V2WSY6_MONRO|nr:putative rta1-like protein [Moniliophthora roreri MCA 2997]KAI3619149.1 putative rta1-like protein [Moniliophthora roreri]
MNTLSYSTFARVSRNLYGYIPTRWICITFLVLFSISSLAHVVQATYSRTWWLLITVVLCGALEVGGWSARLWSSWSPLLVSAYEMQMVCTIIGPTPLIAANFVILGSVIKTLGTEYSRIKPQQYSVIFCSCDVIALLVQGLGAGIASAAVSQGKNPEKGSHIVLVGIAFQMAVITLYVACLVEFLVRWYRDAPVGGKRSNNIKPEPKSRKLDLKLKAMIATILFTSLLLWIRAVYRSIELADDFTGKIITTEVYFNVLDGMMVLLAMITFNFGHPGLLLLSVRDLDAKADGRIELTAGSMRGSKI